MSFSKIVPFLLLIVSMRVEAQPPKLVVPTGHNNAILEFAISSDSRFLASSDIDGVVKIWDIVNGFELMSFTLNRGSTILAFSPDNRLLATADDKGYFDIWSIKENKRLVDYYADEPVKGLSFSPDGSLLAFIKGDTSLYIYSIQKDSVIASGLLERGGAKLKFLPDGKKVAVLDWSEENEKTGIYYFDIETREFDDNGFYYKHGDIIDFTISDDGKYLYSLVNTDSGQIRISKIGSDDTLRFNGHSLKPTQILSSDSSHIIFTLASVFKKQPGYRDSVTLEIKRWDLVQKKCTDSLLVKNYGNISKMVYQKHTKKILVIYDFMEFSLYDLQSFSPPEIRSGHTNNLANIFYFPDGSFFALNNNGFVQKVNLNAQPVIKNIFKDVNRGVLYGSLTPDSTALFFRNQADKKYIKTLNLKTGKITTFLKYDTNILNFRISSMGKICVLYNNLNDTSDQQRVTIYDIYTKKIIADTVDKNSNFSQFNVEFSIDEKTVFFTHYRYDTIFAWNFAERSFRKLKTTEARRGTIIALKVINDSLLITGHAMFQGFLIRNYKNDSLTLIRDSTVTQYEYFFKEFLSGNILGAAGEKLKTIEIDSFKIRHEGLNNSSMINYIGSAHTKNIIYTYGYDNIIRFWDIQQEKHLYSFIPIDSSDFIITVPAGYYQTTRNASKLLHYVTKDLKVITFEQLDVKYNRPDKVLEAIGNTDTALIKSYRKAWEKRIKKLGIDTTAFRDGYSVPEADFANRDAIEFEQRTGTLQLHIKGIDSTYKLDRFNIWVNEAPLFGQRGVNIKRRNSNNLDTTITIQLSQGENRIETSITNVNGTESYRMPLYVNYTSAVKQREMIRFIGIGIDKFSESQYNLQYSTKDIRDLAQKLKERYNDSIIIDTLFNEDVTTQKVKALKQKLLQTTENDKVIVSYSGHGMLSKEYDYYLSTYSVNFNKPEENGLPYDELENLLDSIPARKKLMLIDACHSGEVDKEDLVTLNATSDSLIKGLKPVAYKKEGHLGLKNSFELMQSLFVNVGKSTGATIISAAAGTQFALERNDLKNGVFTYSILEAMQNNPAMKISELKSIVGKRVEELTKGLQKPTSRNETIAVDWRVW
ncbi:MAG: caspase family protein [Chitinophagaceae bacterium]